MSEEQTFRSRVMDIELPKTNSGYERTGRRQMQVHAANIAAQADADLAALRKRVGELEERRRYDRKRVSELCQRIDELQGYHPDRNDDAPPETVSPSPTYAELEAIVAKLPLTADNVRVVPGMELWSTLSDGVRIGLSPAVMYESDEWPAEGEQENAFKEFYSTESAARQALEGGNDDPRD